MDFFPLLIIIFVLSEYCALFQAYFAYDFMNTLSGIKIQQNEALICLLQKKI